MAHVFLSRELPEDLEALTDLALDLRWTWSHAGDALWRALGPEVWELTSNPWLILQDVSRARLEACAADPVFREELRRASAARARDLEDPGWCGRACPGAAMPRVAYFSMEFGLGEALPLYAGGLGVLAGDYLKTASDLGLSLVGVGLLYQEGYFRQVMDADGRQQEVYPYNDPASLPIQPVMAASGGWLHVAVELPGRALQLKVWQARVGRAALYLLDSNEPLNSPGDRGITGKLYGGGPEMRLMQEIVLGIGGWRLLEALGLAIDVCHLNEGHAAFVVLERARRVMEQSRLSFREALWATRAGNAFTSHTPVSAGFDTFSPRLLEKYFPAARGYLAQLGLSAAELLALGRRDPRDQDEPFNMAYLAMRGCAAANGVSRLHGIVSRRIFQGLYPRWPEREVPIGHVTNGVHVPSWDSRRADDLWTRAGGKGRWLGTLEPLADAVASIPDEELWALRAEERRGLVDYARARLARHFGQRGADPDAIALAYGALDPDALTLGFARRFAEYKRPNLLLHHPERLARLLTSSERPVQLIVAGKAHPEDEAGKRLLQAWLAFVQQPAVRRRAVFLEDYDMVLAQELAKGVDVWINTPRRPWEACGTSGMKVLVNGGLNLSERDGWWDEACGQEAGWTLGDGREHDGAGWDAAEAEQLYRLLEEEVVPEFYDRDREGIPRAWVARMRASMARLAPQFSSNRMLREYVETIYLPAAARFRRRSAEGGKLARALSAWWVALERHWRDARFGNVEVRLERDRWAFAVQVYLGGISREWVRVELYAEAEAGGEPVRQGMVPGERIPGAVDGYTYEATVPASRPSWHFTPRIVPYHPDACVPAEAGVCLWPQ